MTEHLTMGDAMRASHPGAGRWMDQQKAAMDAIAEAVRKQITHNPAPGDTLDEIESVLRGYGYPLP